MRSFKPERLNRVEPGGPLGQLHDIMVSATSAKVVDQAEQDTQHCCASGITSGLVRRVTSTCDIPPLPFDFEYANDNTRLIANPNRFTNRIL